MGRVIIALSLVTAACVPATRQHDFVLPPYAEKGCWARFYEQADFGLPVRQIEGPTFVEAVPGGVVQVPNMEQAGIQPLFAEARSLVTGPHAKLVGYSDTLFRGEATIIAPGTRVRDASLVSYPERFASIRLYCQT